MFANVLRITFDILLLKRGPQDLPVSQTLTMGAILAYFGLNFFLLNSGLPAGLAMLHAFLACGVLALYTHAILRWRQMSVRYMQTLAALLLTGLVLGILTIGPMQALQPFLEALAELKEGEELLVQPPAWADFRGPARSQKAKRA